MGNNAQTCEIPIIFICKFSCCIDFFSFFFGLFLLFFDVIIHCYVALCCIASWCSLTFCVDVPLRCWSHLHYIDSCFIVLLIDVFSHCLWLFHCVCFFVFCIASISIVLLVGVLSFCLWLFHHIDYHIFHHATSCCSFALLVVILSHYLITTPSCCSFTLLNHYSIPLLFCFVSLPSVDSSCCYCCFFITFLSC